ncbi:MAG TPA: hypothetical protein VFA18_02105, partial [Gemmataceae bacterium]|nr:hypothetical protein [Gemmataceae bacterium]
GEAETWLCSSGIPAGGWAMCRCGALPLWELYAVTATDLVSDANLPNHIVKHEDSVAGEQP